MDDLETPTITYDLLSNTNKPPRTDSLTVYSFSPDTGEFHGALQADYDPEGDGFLIPWGATEIPPGEPRYGKASVFKDGVWSYVPDYRGTSWYRPDGGYTIIDQLGDPTTFDPPLSPTKAPPEPIRNTSCTPAQGLLALFRTGHYDAYMQAISESSYVPLKIYAQSATMWEINNPYIQAMQLELGLSDDEVQALFDLAVTL